jgi:hypothetical protein
MSNRRPERRLPLIPLYFLGPQALFDALLGPTAPSRCGDVLPVLTFTGLALAIGRAQWRFLWTGSQVLQNMQKAKKWGNYGVVLPHKTASYPIRNALV